MKTERQQEIEQDFLVAMGEQVIAITNLLHRIEEVLNFFIDYSSTLKRIEQKLDTISIQTIKEEYLSGSEDYVV